MRGADRLYTRGERRRAVQLNGGSIEIMTDYSDPQGYGDNVGQRWRVRIMGQQCCDVGRVTEPQLLALADAIYRELGAVPQVPSPAEVIPASAPLPAAGAQPQPAQAATPAGYNEEPEDLSGFKAGMGRRSP